MENKINNELESQEINFIPLSEGLGFHQEEFQKDQLAQMMRPSSASLLQQEINRGGDHFSPKYFPKLSPQKQKSKEDFIPRYPSQKEVVVTAAAGPISFSPKLAENPFVSNGVDLVTNLSQTGVLKEEKIQDQNCSKLEQVSAYIIDLFLVFLASAFMISLMIIMVSTQIDFDGKFLSNLNLVGQLKLLIKSIDPQLYLSLSIVFILNYLFYFIFFDLSSQGTIGKMVLKLKITSLKNSHVPPSLSGVLLRHGIICFSLLMGGLPLLFDFHGRLSDTKIIKNL